MHFKIYHIMIDKRRQGMSNILATLVLIGAAIGGGGLLLVLSTDMINTQFANESIGITSAKISNTDVESWLTISIKNTGNGQIESLIVTVNGLQSEFEESFIPDILVPSKGTALTVSLEELVTEGTSVLVVVSGNTTSGGGVISEALTIRP